MTAIVRFRISCQVPQGQTLVIVGNFDELGNWKSDAGLRTYPQNGNIWRGSVTIKDTSVISTLEFKYAFLNRNTDKIIREETDKYAIELPVQNSDSNDNNTSSTNATPTPLIVRITHSFANPNKLPQSQFSNVLSSKGVGIVVLGKRLLPNGEATEMLKDRVRESLSLYEQLLNTYTHDDITIIMSGGQVQKGHRVPTEARLMLDLAFQYLKPTVTAPNILLEDQSLNTIQNALNTKDVLEDTGIREIYLITTEFHMERSMKIFEIILGPHYHIHAQPSKTKIPQKELDDEMAVETRAIAGLKSRLWSLYRIQAQDVVASPSVQPVNTNTTSPSQSGCQPQTQPASGNNNAPQKKKKKGIILASLK